MVLIGRPRMLENMDEVLSHLTKEECHTHLAATKDVTWMQEVDSGGAPTSYN